MKLLKVGRSASCDIVLPSENVSSLHAEILILDNGEIFLEDKNSTNGTKVGNKKIAPNTEIPIHQGDYVVFADIELPWARVPKAENLNNYKDVLNIGTNFKNDIVIEGTFCSRYHASFRISKNGKKAFIRDLNSKNGVKVNGVKIHPYKDVEIKRNDVIICGDTDISEELRPHIPDPYRWLKKTSIGIAAVAMIAVVAIVIGKIIDGGPDGSSPISPTEMRPATVFVYTDFYYTVTLEDNPLSSVWNGVISLEKMSALDPYTHSSGTAFFIDSLGRMGTNRHVAIPWEYRDKSVDDYVKNEIEQFINEQFKEISDKAEYESFRKLKPYGEAIDKMTTTIPEMNAIISRLRKSPYKISGMVKNRVIGYPGRNYTTPLLEMERCDLVLESGSNDKDVAILQLNTKRTPLEFMPKIFNVNDFRLDQLEPMKEKLYTIGYPMGLGWGLDNKTQSLEPFIRSVSCSKVPSSFNFEFQGESVGGASGSPIFDEYGRLVGVLWGGAKNSATYGIACQAKWLKQLYKKAIGEIE